MDFKCKVRGDQNDVELVELDYVVLDFQCSIHDRIKFITFQAYLQCWYAFESFLTHLRKNNQ